MKSRLLLVLNISFYWVSYCLINNHKSIKIKPLNKLSFKTKFYDIWLNGTGVTLHLGNYRLDFCCPSLLTSGTTQAWYKDRHVKNLRCHRDSKGS